MISLPGYTIKEKIYEGESTIIYRAQHDVDKKIIIIKFLKEEYPSLEKVSRFLHEYEILQNINAALDKIKDINHETPSVQATVKTYGLETYRNSFMLLLEDGGQDLNKYIASKQKLQLLEAIALAIQIAENLNKIHEYRIIHKDINPANILLDAKGTIRIIDFGISSTLPKETLKVSSINKLEGTLHYISPEQTGRMNRGIDYRSDYYSLGVTLYQMFTGTLPFQSNDPLELVYSHIAKLPTTPHEADHAIPKILSDIIMKLLAKTAEERYQSTYGLLSDLRECHMQLQMTGEIHEFPLAVNDLSAYFQISEKLYGRDSEVAYLLKTFARVSEDGQTELMLVAGYSGIGKSSLVHEVQKPIVAKRGYFVSGKFDQLKRNIPYAPFMQALENLVQQLLAETEQEIQQWRERILTALGPNSGVILEVVPLLEKIIGSQPLPPALLGPTETQNRFIFVFQKFIEVLATKNHPLVIFLDDLQWADLASLKLLSAIIQQPAIKYLLIIGAYRDNEVSPAHPLMLILDTLKNGAAVETLTLEPLKISDVQELLVDTLSQPAEIVKTLAEVCHLKTLGNPFFLNQFLRALVDDGLIKFDLTQGTWHWLLDKIKNKTSTDNVIDLVVSNLKRLTSEAQLMLRFAACFGSRFDLQMLSFLSEKNPQETAQIINDALQNSYILPLDQEYRFIINDPNSNARYQFLHDRVQQAAYSLLSEEEKKNIHLKIARHLLEKTPKNKLDEKLFAIVDQYNLGIDLLTQAEEKSAVCKLNLQTGQKAKLSAAYSTALQYFKFAIHLLPENCWREQYALSLQLYTEAAEAAYLSNDFNETENLSKIVLGHAHSILDQVKIYEIKIYTSIARNVPQDAVVTTLEVLKKLGYPLPRNPTQFHAVLSILKSKFLLLGKNHEQLINLPILTEPYKLNTCNILSAAIAPTYYAAPELFPLCCLALFNLSVKYGYSKGTPAAYATYGIILCDVLNDIDRGYQFGQLALKLVEKYRATESEAKITLMVYGFITHWKDPLRDSMGPLLIAHVRGIEIGDLDYSAYSAYFYLAAAFYVGIELPQVAADTKKFYETCRNQYTHGIVVHTIALHGQLIENLLGLSKNPCVFTGNWYQEEVMLQEVIEIKHGFEVFHFYVLKMLMNYLFYDYKAAYQASLAIPPYLGASTGSIPLKAYNFYESLTLIALYQNASPREKQQYLKKIAINQKRLKLWAKFSPVNCLHKYHLVEAELASLKKNIINASTHYKIAIELAKQHEFINEHALANELAAKFYLAEGYEMVASGFMAEAYYSYTKWGAIAKLRHLETTYPQLLIHATSTALSETNLQTSKTQSSEILDLATVVKSSQTIAREIVLSDLLKKLMSFVIENAGAEKGYLLLEKNGEWLIEAATDKDKITVLQSLPLTDRVPQSIIQYVINSKEMVVLDDAAKSNQFITDPYLAAQAPKSVLCIPLVNQGILSGMLYLENNLITGAFTKNRVALLNLLSAQIVISIANARLYSHMSNLNRAYERFVPQEFLNALGKDNIIDVQLGDQVQKDMTIMFCDIRNFTALSEKLTPKENFAFVNNFLSRLEPIISQYDGFIDKYIGDSIMAIYPTHTDDALSSSVKMLNVLYEYNESHPEQAPIRVGIGLNSGLLMLGIVGDEHHMEGTVISDVVNMASRTEELTKVYGTSLLITEETYKRLRNPDKYNIRRLDTVLAKGKSKPVTIYEVFDNDAESIKFLKIQTKIDFEQGVSYFYQNNFSEAQQTFQNVLRLNPSDKAAQLYLERCKELTNKIPHE